MPRPNHLAYSDVKLAGPSKKPVVSVLFESDEQIDALIRLLEGLKGATDNLAHCHLQDDSMPGGPLQGGPMHSAAAEVYFNAPSVRSNQAEIEIRDTLIDQFAAGS